MKDARCVFVRSYFPLGKDLDRDEETWKTEGVVTLLDITAKNGQQQPVHPPLNERNHCPKKKKEKKNQSIRAHDPVLTERTMGISHNSQIIQRKET